MAKQAGLGDQLHVAGYDLGEDVGSIGNIGGGPAALENTGITRSAFQRIGGIRDGRMELSVFFDDATDMAHSRLKLLPTADVILSYLRGTALGGPAACLNAKQANYDPTRGNDASLTIAVEALANQYGLEWGQQFTAGKRTDGGATNGASIDAGAASSFGLQAYLQVFAFTGTDATVRIQSSSDNGAGDAFADVTDGVFVSIGAAPVSQRLQTARNLAIERYLRVVTTTSAGFSNLVFSVVVVRNETEVLF
jgi:hypothetical protein